eukprot:6205206-Pleurochrysis_carterae.AAC.1
MLLSMHAVIHALRRREFVILLPCLSLQTDACMHVSVCARVRMHRLARVRTSECTRVCTRCRARVSRCLRPRVQASLLANVEHGGMRVDQVQNFWRDEPVVEYKICAAHQSECLKSFRRLRKSTSAVGWQRSMP